ncbi:helix-turn-helix domain-containing protein [Bacillus cereus group sp. BfR-BA-01354]|uniref:helix-turn-helix domain-containing protein n=1 Tax=Bacillus cereus group TaxID=86661 RepID=UPI001F57A785
MRAIAKKVQMIRLQEEHCELQVDAEQCCAEQCKIERGCIKLEKNTTKKRTQKVQTPKEKWDEKCQQAVQLFNQGTEYPTIAKIVGCNVSSLYRELKKRGVLQMPKQVTPSKLVKSPKIPSQTKKSKFERYKEYCMYK